MTSPSDSTLLDRRDRLILPKAKGEPMPNVISERIAKKHPKQVKTFYDAFKYMINDKVTDDEMTNVMLVSEKAIKDGLIDFSKGWGASVVLAKAVVGFGIKNLAAGEPVPVIRTHSQLASDTAVAAFIVHYCTDEFDYGRVPSAMLMREVKVKRGGRYKPLLTFVNPHLEALLRSQPEDHHLIGSYLKERGLYSSSAREVDAIRVYLETARMNPALHNGWL